MIVKRNKLDENLMTRFPEKLIQTWYAMGKICLFIFLRMINLPYLFYLIVYSVGKNKRLGILFNGGYCLDNESIIFKLFVFLAVCLSN